MNIRCRSCGLKMIREYRLIVVAGEFQYEGRVINVLARRAVPLANASVNAMLPE